MYIEPTVQVLMMIAMIYMRSACDSELLHGGMTCDRLSRDHWS